ncbi:penicillin-insensitive murein endopeptidase [Bdellovibrio sp. HCB2-146]|uniref:penicillin-insensitive murein endopeptidase n=1 Tax=Bdellovibrio sp. HCB2-146 TaxID=3394362 RepID=UPI0039BC6CF7
MKNATRFKHFIIGSLVTTSLLVGACAPSSDNTPVAVKPTGPAQQNQVKPTVVVTEGHEIVQGGLRSDNLQAVYDDTTQSMTLHGQMEITPFDGSPKATLDVALAGTSKGDSRITLKPYKADVQIPEGMNIAAKATCLGDEGDCGTSFIDIYVQYKDHVYRHQVETVSNEIAATKTIPLPLHTDHETEAVDESHEEEAATAPELDDDNEPIEDDDDFGAPGQYIGDVQNDLKELFNIEPKKTPSPLKPESKEETKPEAPATPEQSSPLKPAPVKPEPTKPSKPAEPTAPAKPAPAPAPTKPEIKKPEPAKPATPEKQKPVKTPEKTPEKTPPKTPEKPATPPAKEPVPAAPEKPEQKTETEQIPPTIKAPDEKKDSPIESDLNVAKKIIQVIGSIANGSLKNALSLFDLTKKETKTGFYLSRPELKTYYGSNELVYLIQKMGKFTLENFENYEVRVGDLSKQKGGTIYTRKKGRMVPKHKSHKNGLDADISYYFTDPKHQGQSALSTKGKIREDWEIEKQWELFKMFNETKLVDRIFIHRKLKRALCDLAKKRGEVQASTQEGLAFETLWRLQARPSDHADHFHLRVKCSSIQSACAAPMAEPPRRMGCF